MKPTSFKETNHVLGAGGNPNTDQLAVCLALNPEASGGQKIPFVISCWKLSKEELEQVNRTGQVWLSIMGPGQPPVILGTANPFESGYTPINLD